MCVQNQRHTSNQIIKYLYVEKWFHVVSNMRHYHLNPYRYLNLNRSRPIVFAAHQASNASFWETVNQFFQSPTTPEKHNVLIDKNKTPMANYYSVYIHSFPRLMAYWHFTFDIKHFIRR